MQCMWFDIDPCKYAVVSTLCNVLQQSSSSVRQRWALTFLREHCRFLFSPENNELQFDILRRKLFYTCYDVISTYQLAKQYLNPYNLPLAISRYILVLLTQISNCCGSWNAYCTSYTCRWKFGNLELSQTRITLPLNGLYNEKIVIECYAIPCFKLTQWQ